MVVLTGIAVKPRAMTAVLGQHGLVEGVELLTGVAAGVADCVA